MDDKTQLTWQPTTPVPYFTASSYSTPRIRWAIWLLYSYPIQARTLDLVLLWLFITKNSNYFNTILRISSDFLLLFCYAT